MTAARPSTSQDRLARTLKARGPWPVALCFSAYPAQWVAVVGFLLSVYGRAGRDMGTPGTLTALAAVNMVGNIVASRRLQRGVPPSWLRRVGFVAMAVGSLAEFAEVGGAGLSPALRCAGVLVFSAVGGLIPATLFALAVKRAPSEDAASTTVGWMQPWCSIGQCAGPTLMAWPADRAAGWQRSWIVSASCALPVLLLVERNAPDAAIGHKISAVLRP